MLGLAAKAPIGFYRHARRLEKTMFKELKGSMAAMSHQIENFNNEIEINFLNKSQVEILELKSNSN